ncbi:hypothetical protein KDA_76480 [Dictyobacter alpinus]|uniref:DinB-like domain-containing protein n=1 Tax=Dictyobacter alpinus TaxID=2014873 RepID=A0A402BLE5_9CHLR|nr:DinB family protein [Dictyobacter alpinus]GCE32164.1 hypothetical protein KDA_76480 [Dictyobacter alpinus]
MQGSLALFYQGWHGHQQRLVKALAPLTSPQLTYSTIPRWSIGRIAAHIIAARVWWMCSRAGEGSAHLAPMEHWDSTGQPVRKASELVSGLEQTWRVLESALERWTPADLEHIFPAIPDDPTERTKGWIIWHVLEHDLHHSGEISLTLGAHGLPALSLE